MVEVNSILGPAEPSYELYRIPRGLQTKNITFSNVVSQMKKEYLAETSWFSESLPFVCEAG